MFNMTIYYNQNANKSKIQRNNIQFMRESIEKLLKKMLKRHEKMKKSSQREVFFYLQLVADPGQWVARPCFSGKF